jgi:hypothetical protein
LWHAKIYSEVAARKVVGVVPFLQPERERFWRKRRHIERSHQPARANHQVCLRAARVKGRRQGGFPLFAKETEREKGGPP